MEPLTGAAFEYPPWFEASEDQGSLGDLGRLSLYEILDGRIRDERVPAGLELSVYERNVSDIFEWLADHSASSDDQAEGDYFTNVSSSRDAVVLDRGAVEFDWVAVDGIEVHSIVVAYGRYVIALGWFSSEDHRTETRQVFEEMLERVRDA